MRPLCPWSPRQTHISAGTTARSPQQELAVPEVCSEGLSLFSGTFGHREPLSPTLSSQDSSQLHAACGPQLARATPLSGPCSRQSRVWDVIQLWTSAPVCLPWPWLVFSTGWPALCKMCFEACFCFFLIHPFVCLYVCRVHHVCIYITMYVDTYMHACGFTCVCAHGNQRLTSGIFFSHSLPVY